jgi:hypothetical protein
VKQAPSPLIELVAANETKRVYQGNAIGAGSKRVAEAQDLMTLRC